MASPPTAPESPAPAAAAPQPRATAGESCPLCGAPLQPTQEWCLSCGAAARTRLAASPNWKAPVAALAAVMALSLGVLAAALVKLAGETGPPPPAITRTVTTVATAAIAPPAPNTAAVTPVPGATTTAPGTTGSAQAGGPINRITGSNAATGTAPPAGGTQRTGSKTPLGPALRKRLRELNLSGALGK